MIAATLREGAAGGESVGRVGVTTLHGTPFDTLLSYDGNDHPIFAPVNFPLSRAAGITLLLKKRT